jgi:hypothetical protein
MGQEGDYEEVDKAWSETGRWAKEVAQFKHAKIQAIRLGGDPNAPMLPENMTLDELRDSIWADLERLRERGVLDLPRLASNQHGLVGMEGDAAGRRDPSLKISAKCP